MAKCDDTESIAKMTALQDEFSKIIGAQVQVLKAQGFTWAEIAAPLGITRQGAYERYGGAVITPIGYQGAARHSYTPGCDGFHESQMCPEPRPAPVVISPETMREIERVSAEWPDGIHTCAELQKLEPGRRPCSCGRCPPLEVEEVLPLVREAYDAAVAEVGPPPPDLYQPGGFEVSPPWRSAAEGEWDSSR